MKKNSVNPSEKSRTRPDSLGNDSYDVVVVGGGLAGLTQALLLAREGFSVACVDQEKPLTQLDKDYDTRTTAISWGSRNVLRKAGVWEAMESAGACPIKDIRILDGASPFVLAFLSKDVENREFGWIVDNFDLRLALHTQAGREEKLHHVTGAAVVGYERDDAAMRVRLVDGLCLSAPLVLGCDGRGSKTREFMGIGTWGHDYGQTALVCIVEHERPHDNIAVEHFLADGPFASLPMVDDENGRHRSAIVWSIHGGDAAQWLRCSDEAFNLRLNALYTAAKGHYRPSPRPAKNAAKNKKDLQDVRGDKPSEGGLFGAARVVGRRAGWPLGITMAYAYIAPRMALLAEAAHGIHPIAGQGLNISLRDVAAMTEILCDARDRGESDWGAPALLAEYQKRRRMDNTMMGMAMEGFNGLFSNNRAPLRIMRRLGLRVIARMPAFKRFFMTQAMGTVGHVPDLVKHQDGRQSK